MTEFERGQSNDRVPEHIKPSNFVALKRFMETAALKHTESFGKFYLDDPTTMGFSLWFDPKSPLFNKDSNNGESAYLYLKHRGEDIRAEKLNRFIQQFMLLAAEYPHFFLTLSGLGNIYEFPTGQSVYEKTLTISTNESMDLRMSSLIDNYVQAVYDINYRRRAVPVNLTEFKMKIFISEIRSFRTFVGNQASGTNNGFRELNDSLGIFIINFSRCSFDFSASNPFLDTINNSKPEIAENVFSIVTGNMNLNNNKVDVFDIVQRRDTQGNPVDPIPTAADAHNNRTDALESKLNKDKNPVAQKADDLGNKFKSTLTDKTDALKNEISDSVDAFKNRYNPSLLVDKMANKYFFDVIDSKFSKAQLGNVFFENNGLIGAATNIAGDILENVAPQVYDSIQQIRDTILNSGIVPGAGGLDQPRNNKERQADVFDRDNLSPNDRDNLPLGEDLQPKVFDNDDLSGITSKQDALFKTLTDVFDNADKLSPQEIDTMLEFFTKSNLGNVFTGGNNIS